MVKDKNALFRAIPAVDRLLESDYLAEIIERYPRNLILKAIHRVLDEYRKRVDADAHFTDPSALNVQSVSDNVIEMVEKMARSSLRQVINATGVIVHTNLGRSILGKRVLSRFEPLAGGYCNLEYDLEQGRRGSRYSHVEGILKELTGAEAAMVVNNNAAAVFVTLETLAKGREVIVSRSELVEIGGSFRIPDVMKKSGARMIEVGTTNKTHLRDYEEVIGPDTALLLRVHRSNFQIVGFTEDVETSQLIDLGRKNGLPVIEDLGSGCLVDFSKYGLSKEPTVQEALTQGLDLITFSGDKLLGGPQAGIILGRQDLVDAIKKNQLTRALRIDKLTLLALEETLNIYRDEKVALSEIPTLKMITEPYKELKAKAGRLFRMIADVPGESFSVDLMDGHSKVGGGALPLLDLPTRLVCLTPQTLSAHQMDEWFKSFDPPIIVRIEENKVLLDVRTIQDFEVKTVAQAVRELGREVSG
ncbi:MAG: L-seryl-tRNA(Sec) selenium transferase [Deltaproteobacteria bacterium]|nr:L-seryl-tRNA(Sec) selenium transferase [Deltaproteobacteria bacterium]